MVWKQDLAKLKQQFQEAGEPKSKVPLPKPVPTPPVPANLSIEEQDTLFLNAMGRRPAPQVQPRSKVSQAQEPGIAADLTPLAPAPEEDFQAAMGGLKGVKPLVAKIPAEKVPTEPLAPPAIEPDEVSEPLPSPSAQAEIDAVVAPVPAGRDLPERIQLAAGMAIEVDGSLDLRGHTTVDAMERFRERLQDGVFLGWRTFHVIFGNSEELNAAFRAFLASSEAQVIARFAQAPIPMGGNQAWVIYYAAPGH